MMIYTVALLNIFFVFNLKLVSFDQSLCTLLFCACGVWKLLWGLLQWNRRVFILLKFITYFDAGN